MVLPTAFGVVTCLDAKTGKVHWEHEFSNGFTSSPVIVNDRVYIIDLRGKMQIFKLGRKFEHFAESDIGDAAYATPAFVGDKIYIRGFRHLYCIGEKLN